MTSTREEKIQLVRDIFISGAYKYKVHKVYTNNTNAQAYGIPLKTTGSQSLVGDRKAGSSLLLHCRGWALQVTADYMSEKCGLGEGTCGGERLEPGGGYMGDWNC